MAGSGRKRSWYRALPIFHVNAMSTNVRQFSTVYFDGCGRMSVSFRGENLGIQRLVAYVLENPKLLESLMNGLIT